MSKELFISSTPHETKVAVVEDDQLVEVYFERDTHTGLVGGIYKGRVSRVLPGMQSAFVDIGLDRDAFLYVSDFFEDAEEYDKIVAEAEARVTRYTETAQPPAAAEATPGTAVAAAPSEPVAETPPLEAASLPAPVGIIVDGVEQQPPVIEPTPTAVPPPPETTAQVSSAASSHPGPYERPQGQHQDFRRDDQRGRRRRRHGRPFGDRKFGPKPEFRERPAEHRPAPVATSTAQTFEVLPGESLAKYKHTPGPAAAEIAHEPTPVEPTEAHPDARSPESVSSPAPAPPEAETPHVRVSAEPDPLAAIPTELAPAEPARTEVEAPHVKLSVEPVSPPESLPLPVVSPPGASARENASSIAEPSDATMLAEHFPPSPECPEASSSEAGQASQAEPESASKPRPLWNRLVSNLLGRPSEAAEGADKASSEELAPEAGTHSDSPVKEIEGPAEVATESELEAEAAEAGAEPEATGSPEALEQETSEAAPEGPAPEQVSTTAAREYTLREPHQRPRFAPRRKGRFGKGQRDLTPGGRGPRRESPRPGNNQPVQIAELLKEGQEIQVQIAKEPLGRKGARITSHIALPGRYLVYMPTVEHIGVSRKISSEEERLRLKNIILDNRGSVTGGFIVRTAGAGRPEEELKADMKFLSTLWSDIRSNAEKTKAPALLHRDLDLMQRILRDILSPDFKCVRVDSEIEYERAVEFVSRCQPALVGHVKFYTRDTPLFEEFGIQAEIDKALKSKVWLKSGGYIVINQTEALVAIDVNTGKYVGKTNRLEDTIVKTNIDAVKEIVRQIRLRDLGGIIVIDFIDMDERRNRNKVVQALEEALRFDRAPTKILSFNDFGLVAITRKRVKQSLERTLCEPCAYCTGSGWIKSVTTICYEILAEARKMAAEHEGSSLTLRVHPDVARALKSREGIVLSELEAITRKDVIVKSDVNVHQERFEIY
jgi:Rne/Rng family ribonuclease